MRRIALISLYKKANHPETLLPLFSSTLSSSYSLQLRTSHAPNKPHSRPITGISHTMSCRRTGATSLFVVALLIVSLLTLHAHIACARHVVLNPNNGLNDRGDNQNLAKVLASASTDAAAANKGISGRKLGAPNKEAANNKATGAAAVTTSTGSRMPRTAEMRAAGKHGDPAAEMDDMLRRDYAWKASRRRPINNGATPLQVNKKP